MFHTPPVLEANQKLAGVGLPSTPSRLTGMAGAAPAAAAPAIPVSLEGVDGSPTPASFWLASSTGGVWNMGRTASYGQLASPPTKPVVGISPTHDKAGYWLIASDGGIFSFGDAHFYGSTGSLVLNRPVVGMPPTPDWAGYWLIASDGGIFSFGDAHFYGSTGSLVLNRPVQHQATGGAVEGGVAKGENPAVTGHQPVALAVGSRGHAHHRPVQHQATGGAVEVGVPEREDAAVTGHQPVAGLVVGGADSDDRLGRRGGQLAVGGSPPHVPHPAGTRSQPETGRSRAPVDTLQADRNGRRRRGRGGVQPGSCQSHDRCNHERGHGQPMPGCHQGVIGTEPDELEGRPPRSPLIRPNRRQPLGSMVLRSRRWTSMASASRSVAHSLGRRGV